MTGLTRKRTQRVTEAGRKAIIMREGFKLTAYKCPAGVWTIGIGHTGKDVTPGRVITEQEALQIFKNDLNPVEGYLSDFGFKLKPWAFDAVASFLINVGALKFSKSTLLRLLKAGNSDLMIAQQFLRWKFATMPNGEKKILPGLAARRYSEALQFIGEPNHLRSLGYPDASLPAPIHTWPEIENKLGKPE